MSVNSQDDFDKFEWAIKNGDLDQARALLATNKEIAAQAHPAGRYPLVVASDYGQTEAIKFLVSNGADVNVSDKYGITPLLAAIFENHTESVKLLLEKGAKKTGTSPDGRSYLDAAESNEIKTLLQ